MKRKFICPKEIEKLYEDDPGVGRAAAIEWIDSIEKEVSTGDEIWLPEIGWMTKTRGRKLH